MAQTVKDSFLDLERHRQLLEDNIEKLRKSLRHWQTWEAEYEGLKEEILAKPSLDHDQFVSLARQYDGDLVTKKEIEDILGPAASRSPAQVVSLLDRRLDYVLRNVRTVEKQIEAAENKLATATIISTPDVRNEEGLPMTDIIEELDDEGNVISSRISTPGSSKPQLLEVLQKAGVKNLPESLTSSGSASMPAAAGNEVKAVKAGTKPTERGLKFSEDTKPGPEPEKSKTAKRIEEIMSIANQQDKLMSKPPIIPPDESPKDAALRREMLQYGMSEIGAVVAELDFEDGSDWSDQDSGEDETSNSDDEDAFGRSTGQLVDDELRQRMIELEERLGVRMMENIGNKASDYDVVREGIGRVTVNGQDGPTDAAVPPIMADQDERSRPSPSTEVSRSISSPKTKKSVKFSENLDISPASQPLNPTSGRPARSGTTTTAPVGDVVERVPSKQSALLTSQKKTSRFKSARGTTPQVVNGPFAPSRASNTGPSLALQAAKASGPKPFSTSIQFSPADDRTRVVPSGPEGKALATSVVERDIPINTSVPEPDELDPQLLHQEVATEYHRMRNRMIQRQGGYQKEEEREIVPFTEEEGGPRKLSRFKAARLARS